MPYTTQGTLGMQGPLPFPEEHQHAHARSRDHKRGSPRKDKPRRTSAVTAKEEAEEVAGGCHDADCPVVHSVSPSHGGAAGGTVITVTGRNLAAVEQVSQWSS